MRNPIIFYIDACPLNTLSLAKRCQVYRSQVRKAVALEGLGYISFGLESLSADREHKKNSMDP